MRVIIADDVPMLRDLYRQSIQALGVDVVAEAATTAELLIHVGDHRPDAVLVDINFGGHHGRPQDDDGLHAAERLRADDPLLGIVMFSVHMTPAYLRRITAIGDGTHIGYLGKERIKDARTIVDALARVIAGETVIDRTLAGQMLRTRRVQDPMARLTARQREALELLAQGRTNKAIAEQMKVAVPTVEAYLSEVFKALDIPTSPDDHKRVLAVLTWLRSAGARPFDTRGHQG
ncbi:response regulator transcription factor [Actinomadura sp. DC4]|uniref:response regulator n=1 Tax=Actinomadura sp. DC4 TaxID=3055069 RepID=UPI0025B131B0|nr:response regulator transcription factor [Actinomadura sp. DC4]MDN3353840.1 response regulator transcription factor [Actinomadura sp. DC4]